MEASGGRLGDGAAMAPPDGVRRPPGGDYEGVAKTGQSQPKDFRASKTAKRRQGLGNMKKKIRERRKTEEKRGEAGGVLSEIDLSIHKNIKIVASSTNISSKLLKKLVNF